MKDVTKNLAVVISFFLVLAGFLLANIICPDSQLSAWERRMLSGAPQLSLDSLLSGKYSLEFEKYSLDQFVFRNQFRSLKAKVSYYLLAMKDNNGIYVLDEGIYKIEPRLNEQSVFNAAQKFNDLKDLYFPDHNVYYAVIPDKNYFVAADNGYPAMDYERMLAVLDQNVRDMKYIDLFSALTVFDYYRTDIHWRQDRIEGVAQQLLAEMNVSPDLAPSYIRHEIYPFYGSFYGQAALPLHPDRLVYLTNDALENAEVYDYAGKSYGPVYAREVQSNLYDLFLSGAKPLLAIDNPANSSGRELIIFRDSFGSSIAPLLVEGYSRITLVDLRYLSSWVLDDYITFTPNQDVLFLYSTSVINNSWMLR